MHSGNAGLVSQPSPGSVADSSEEAFDSAVLPLEHEPHPREAISNEAADRDLPWPAQMAQGGEDGGRMESSASAADPRASSLKLQGREQTCWWGGH